MRGMVEVKAYYRDVKRFGIPDDVYQGVEALFIEDFGETWGEEFAKNELAGLVESDSPLYAIFVALDTDLNVVGRCYIEKRKSTWGLGGSFVTESLRGQRISSAMMDKVEAEAVAHAIKFIERAPSGSAPEYWRPAIVRRGYKEIRGRDDEWRLDLSRKER